MLLHDTKNWFSCCLLFVLCQCCMEFRVLAYGMQCFKSCSVCVVCRGNIPADGSGDSGGTGLVSGPAGDHSDPPLSQRDGLQQGAQLSTRKHVHLYLHGGVNSKLTQRQAYSHNTTCSEYFHRVWTLHYNLHLISTTNGSSSVLKSSAFAT